MTVEESIEDLKTAVTVCERLRVGLVPFVKCTYTKKFRDLGPAELKELSGSKNPLPDAGFDYASMDVAAILNLMQPSAAQKIYFNAFKKAFSGEIGKILGLQCQALRQYRNSVAHHPSRMVDLQDALPFVLDIACIWLKDIADGYPEAKEQLEMIEELISSGGFARKHIRDWNLLVLKKHSGPEGPRPSVSANSLQGHPNWKSAQRTKG